VARAVHDFDAADISDQPFGWNLPNWLLRREFLARLEAMPGWISAPASERSGC
jgi:2-octaprenyl-6-methoxyphenol hydroxylase